MQHDARTETNPTPTKPRVWATPLLLLVAFTAGITLCLTPGVSVIIGAALAAIPLAVVGWKLARP